MLMGRSKSCAVQTSFPQLVDGVWRKIFSSIHFDSCAAEEPRISRASLHRSMGIQGVLAGMDMVIPSFTLLRPIQDEALSVVVRIQGEPTRPRFTRNGASDAARMDSGDGNPFGWRFWGQIGEKFFSICSHGVVG